MPLPGFRLVVLVLILAQATFSSAGEVLSERQSLDFHLDETVNLYQFLHSHPELSGEEVNTSRLLSEELTKAHAEVTTGVGGLGVVGVLRNGKGPTVLIRSDMDALPVTETTGVPYASCVTADTDSGTKIGVMHACGHDVHMASLVGTARWLAEHKDLWAGTVLLVAQPSEESACGARRMLADGLYTRFPRPDYALALHVSHDLEAGKVGYHVGPSMAGTTGVTITVNGRGGHGALPHTTVDPVVLASMLVLDLQTIVSREVNPLDSAVLTVGSIRGGDKSNIIPETVTLGLTIRWFRPEVRDLILNGITRRARALATGHNAPEPLVEVNGGTSPLVNEAGLVGKVVPAFQEVLGDAFVSEIPPEMTAEDFGLYAQGGVPTFMFRLGTVSPQRWVQSEAHSKPLDSLHSPRFLPDSAPTLRTGVRAMSKAVITLLPPARNISGKFDDRASILRHSLAQKASRP